MQQLEHIVEPLLNWYHKNARILPWREEITPYRVWISEIMLQQTRVEAVKSYFDNFMKTIPNIETLAHIDEDVLLKLWEGLGYYNRARNLKKAAIIINEKYQGIFPNDYETLLSLPGIGEYTAGAILSIAYAKKIPAVDGNVLRVVTRILEQKGNILDTKVKKKIIEQLSKVIPQDASSFNQALMELGATICLPKGMPLCNVCPLKELCQSHQKGTMLNYPEKETKRPRKIEEKTILLIETENKLLLHKRKEEGLLASLYEFPNLPYHLNEQQIKTYLKERNLKPIKIEPLEKSIHLFTHLEWNMIGYKIKVKEEKSLEDNFWIPISTWVDYAIPTAFKKYIKKI